MSRGGGLGGARGRGAEHVELSPLGFLAPWGVLGKERCHIGDAIGREQLQESLNFGWLPHNVLCLPPGEFCLEGGYLDATLTLKAKHGVFCNIKHVLCITPNPYNRTTKLL